MLKAADVLKLAHLLNVVDVLKALDLLKAADVIKAADVHNANTIADVWRDGGGVNGTPGSAGTAPSDASRSTSAGPWTAAPSHARGEVLPQPPRATQLCRWNPSPTPTLPRHPPSPARAVAREELVSRGKGR